MPHAGATQQCRGRAPSTPTTEADEKNLAEWVFSKHNAGEAAKAKVADYVNKTDPVWLWTFCVAETGKGSGYLQMTALKP